MKELKQQELETVKGGQLDEPIELATSYPQCDLGDVDNGVCATKGNWG